MKRFFSVFLCLVVVLGVASCRSDEPQVEATVVPEGTGAGSSAAGNGTADEIATAVAGTVQSMTTTGRGGESTAEPPLSSSLLATESDSEALEDANATVETLFSIPFEVQPDGFSFRNYGAGFPEGRFTIADLRAQFGDGVCSRIDAGDDLCIPTVEAQQWIDDRNADMSYGHCIGFTVASYRFAEGEFQPAAFTPGASTTYDIEKEPAIMRTIAANGALYWAKSVWSSEVTGTPREVLDSLIALSEPVDLSIYLPGLAGGHSLLAYGVEQVAPQQYHILVYDNNFPGEQAFVEVDYEANTWRYAQGAVNPEQTAVPYEGDATTQTLRYIPLTAYDNVTCPFCSAGSASEDEQEAFTLLTFLGQGEVLVKTALGNVGIVAGELINEIPGASFILQRGQLAANDAPDVVLPAGLDYTVEFTGLDRVSSLNRNYSIVLDSLTPSTEQNSLAVTLATQTMEFQAGGEQSPVIKTTIRQDGAAYSVALLGIEFTDGQRVSIGVAEEGGNLEIGTSDEAITDGTLLITRLTEDTEALFATTSLAVTRGGSVGLDVAAWDGVGRMDVYLDDDGNGTYAERPARLTNTPLTDVLRLSDRGVASLVLDKVGPFLGADGLLPVLAGLATQQLSGRAIGEILQPLALTTAQLSELIADYALPVPELAELLFALRLSPDQLEALVLSLDLETEDETALRELLTDLELFQAILNEWDFRNSSDMTQLALLLNERQLTVAMLGQLLPRFALSQAQLELLLGSLALSESDLQLLAEQLGVDIEAIVQVIPPTGPTQSSRNGTPPATTVTATPTATATGRVVAGMATATPTRPATRAATATANADNPNLPLPTDTPAPYPYPGVVPPSTRTPAPYPYPGPNPTATPKYLSRAFCEGDDLRVIVEELTWRDVVIEIWSGESLLVTGTIEPDGEPFEVSFDGPGTWEDLVIKSPDEPTSVPLGSVTCP